jgi:uncharacterized protein YbjT (DUF2867 family)
VRVAVAGGTGLVGRYVVAALAGAGHDPVVLTRSRGVDLTTGQGLDDALAGAAVVIDVSNVSTSKRDESVAFFASGTEHLLEAGDRAGVRRHVALSIVGVDRVDFGYYEGKRRQEDLVLAAPMPSIVLRATQFHEFAGQLLARGRGPIAVVPRMRVQPIAAREVADALVALVAEEGVGFAPELAGPQEHQMTDLARQLLHSRGSHRLLLPVRVPGAGGRAMAEGGLLPTLPGLRGRQTFAQWLATLGGEGGSA